MERGAEKCEDPERALLAKARSGDRVAMGTLLAANRNRIQVMIRARLGAEHRRWDLLEDLTQEVHVAALDAVLRLRSDDSPAFRAFLSRIVTRKVADHFRRESRHVRVFSAQQTQAESTMSALELLYSVPVTASSPSSRAARNENIAIALERLACLPESQRRILILSFFDQLETLEIAELLEVTPRAAAMQILRAVRALQKQWPARAE